MKLIGSNTSPYTRKVRIVLAEKKLDYEYVQDSPLSADSKISHYNPLGKIPCLILEGGEAIFDSRVIVEYVDTLSPVGRLIATQGRERAEVKTWEALADGLMDAAVAIRLELAWSGRSKEQQSQTWVDHQMRKIEAGLKAMSAGLNDKTYCGGVHINLADIAVGSALGFLDFRFPQIDWRGPYPNLRKLFDRLMQRQSFQDTTPG